MHVVSAAVLPGGAPALRPSIVLDRDEEEDIEGVREADYRGLSHSNPNPTISLSTPASKKVDERDRQMVGSPSFLSPSRLRTPFLRGREAVDSDDEITDGMRRDRDTEMHTLHSYLNFLPVSISFKISIEVFC